MKRNKYANILWVLILLCGLVFAAQTRARADAGLQIGMVLDDGRVLIYRGASAGMKAGDVFHVAREGAVIGAVRLVEVKDVYSLGVILEQAWPLAANDDLLPAGEAMEKPERKEPADERGTETKVERKDAQRIEDVVKEERVTEETVEEEKAEEEKADAEKAEAEDKEKEEKVEKKKVRTKKEKDDEEDDEAVAEKKVDDEEEEKEEKEKAEKKKEKSDEGVKEKEAEEKDDKEKKPRTADVAPGKLLYYDRYRVRVGYIRPRGNHFDQTLAADIDRDAAVIFGIDWITVERPNMVMDMRFLYGEPRIDSGAGSYDGESRYMQIAVNFIKSHRANYFDDHYYFYGLGVGYQRMGAGVTCVAETGCANGVGYKGFSSTREDNVGLNLIYGYHFTTMNVELDYVAGEGDFYLTFDYPLGTKEVYRLVDKK